MELSKALMQYIDEMKSYGNYMECYEEYKVKHPEEARMYHKMAQEELAHTKNIMSMYPELEELIHMIKTQNPH